MTKLSELAETLIGSEIVKLGNEIKLRTNNGEKIFNFTIGDFAPSIFPIPDGLKKEIIEAYENDITSYPPAEGLLELRKAVSEFIFDEEGIHYNTDEIQIAAGGRPLIYALFRTIVGRGDKVIYALPSWNNNHYIHMNSGTPCPIETSAENNFMPVAEDIRPHLHGARLLCLCSPQNPTGTAISKTELEKICDMVLAENNSRAADERKLFVLFDQMYFTLVFGDTKHFNPVSLRPEMKDFTIFVDGISKAFAATGLRVGWSMGPARVIAKMKALLTHIGAWAPIAEQKATAAFLNDKQAIKKFQTGFKKEISERLWLVYNGFIALKEKGYAVDAVAPQAAMYLTIKLDLKGQMDGESLLETQDDVTSYVLREAKLAVVPFYVFGSDHELPLYRLSVGTALKEDIAEMLDFLEIALKNLKLPS